MWKLTVTLLLAIFVNGITGTVPSVCDGILVHSQSGVIRLVAIQGSADNPTYELYTPYYAFGKDLNYPIYDYTISKDGRAVIIVSDTKVYVINLQELTRDTIDFESTTTATYGKEVRLDDSSEAFIVSSSGVEYISSTFENFALSNSYGEYVERMEFVTNPTFKQKLEDITFNPEEQSFLRVVHADLFFPSGFQTFLTNISKDRFAEGSYTGRDSVHSTYQTTSTDGKLVLSKVSPNAQFVATYVTLSSSGISSVQVGTTSQTIELGISSATAFGFSIDSEYLYVADGQRLYKYLVADGSLEWQAELIFVITLIEVSPLGGVLMVKNREGRWSLVTEGTGDVYQTSPPKVHADFSYTGNHLMIRTDGPSTLFGVSEDDSDDLVFLYHEYDRAFEYQSHTATIDAGFGNLGLASFRLPSTRRCFVQKTDSSGQTSPPSGGEGDVEDAVASLMDNLTTVIALVAVGAVVTVVVYYRRLKKKQKKANEEANEVIVREKTSKNTKDSEVTRIRVAPVQIPVEHDEDDIIQVVQPVEAVDDSVEVILSVEQDNRVTQSEELDTAGEVNGGKATNKD